MSKYESYEERDERDWVVFYCRATSPMNFSVRLFPTLDRARMYYGNTCKNLCESPEDLAYKFGGTEMLEAFRELRTRKAANSSLLKGSEGPHCEDVDDDYEFNRGKIAQALWDLIQDVADRVHGINLINEMEDEEMFVIRLDRMASAAGLEVIGGYSGQKKIVAMGLVDFGKSKATEIELTEMMRGLVSSGKLKTKQDPMRIFRYYAPELGDDGFLFYPGKRHKSEEHALNA